MCIRDRLGIRYDFLQVGFVFFNGLGFFAEVYIVVIQWVSPLAALPEEGSYVLIKQQFPGESAVCCQAAYENGSFWAVGCDAERPLAENQVAAWAYAPYDGRATLLGRLTAGRR